MLTPGKGRAVHNLQGTIKRFIVDSVDSNIVYHCHAAMTKEALDINPVWTIWREDLTTGKLVNPIDGATGEPKPDGNKCDGAENLTYWDPSSSGVWLDDGSGDINEPWNDNDIWSD